MGKPVRFMWRLTSVDEALAFARLGLTGVMGLVDAVSFLSLGRAFCRVGCPKRADSRQFTSAFRCWTRPNIGTEALWYSKEY